VQVITVTIRGLEIGATTVGPAGQEEAGGRRTGGVCAVTALLASWGSDEDDIRTEEADGRPQLGIEIGYRLLSGLGKTGNPGNHGYHGLSLRPLQHKT